MRHRIVLTLATLAATFALAPAAGAATTIGSALTATPIDAVACNSTCTLVTSASSVHPAASPVDGVVVRWRVKTNGAGGPFGLRIAKPFTGNVRTGAGASALETAGASGVNEFATRLPIRSGDNVGLTITSATVASNVLYGPGFAIPGSELLYFNPQLPEYGTGTDPTVVNTGTELLFNADIEADADRDGYGDETQDRCPGVFGTSDGCDVTAPQAVLTSYAPQSVGSLKVKVSVNETANFQARAVVKYRSKGKRVAIKSRIAKLTLNGTNLPSSMSLRFTSKQRKQLRAQIKKGKKLIAVVTVTATDPSGNKSSLTAKIRLKR